MTNRGGATLTPVIAKRTDSDLLFNTLVKAASIWRPIEADDFQTIDWNRILHSAAYHGLFPVVSQRILESPIEIRPDVREQIRSAFHDSMLRSFPFVQEVLRIKQAFDLHEISVIPYKGPALAEELWGSFSFRNCTDLDFLVRTSDVDRAGDVLLKLGYKRIAEISAHLRPSLMRNASEEVFRHRESGIPLELQWAPAPRVFSLGFDMDRLWQRTRTIEFAGEQVLSPSLEDLLLLLAVHGWKHNWSRLLWIGDVALLLRKFQLDWEALLEVARRQRLVGILTLALQIAHETFDSPLPPICLEISQGVQKLAEELIVHLRADQACSYLQWHRYMLAARDGHADCAAQLARFAFTPGLGEYAACNLPAWATSGYRLVRIARVLGLSRRKVND